MYLDRKRGIATGALAALACLLVASSSALVALTVLVLMLMLSQRVIRLPWYIMQNPLKRMSVFVIAGLLSASLLVVPSLRNMVIAQTINKGSSVSALVRFSADIYSLDLLVKTHGLGVGLGSNRPSSLVTSILSQVGVVEFLFLLSQSSKFCQRFRKRIVGFGGVASACCCGCAWRSPDISYPFLWVLLAMAVQSKAFRYGQKTLPTVDRTQQNRPGVARAALPACPASIGNQGISAPMFPS